MAIATDEAHSLSLYFLTASLSPDQIHGKCHGHGITLP